MKRFRIIKIVEQKKEKIINSTMYFNNEIMFHGDNVFRENELNAELKRYVLYLFFYIDNEDVEKE